VQHTLFKAAHPGESCIIFFSGWGMDHKPFCLLSPGNYNLYFFYDFRSLEPEISLPEIFSSYKKIKIIAWSFGVWVCAYTLAKNNISAKCTAVNGTLCPVHDRFGIKKRIFQATIDALDEQSLLRFYRNMFTGDAQAEKFLSLRPGRTLENQKEELKALSGYFEKYPEISGRSDLFENIIISSRDRIIPAARQKNFWEKTGYKEINSGHFMFFDLFRWDAFND